MITETHTLTSLCLTLKCDDDSDAYYNEDEDEWVIDTNLTSKGINVFDAAEIAEFFSRIAND